MHINNPDALKIWLTAILEPLCDADPAALARYVLALLKKDKPTTDLHQCMLDQLDVFLGAETRPFLDKLMTVIRTEEYLPSAPLVTAATVDNNTVDPVAVQVDEPQQQGVPSLPAFVPTPVTSSAGTLREVSPPTATSLINVDKPTKDDRVQQQQSQVITPVKSIHSPIKGPITPNVDLMMPGAFAGPAGLSSGNVLAGERRRRSRNRSRSRSRSPERGLIRPVRARESRERINRYRNESPPGRRYERRPPGKRSPGKTSYSRRNHSRSRSQSPSYRKSSRSLSPNLDVDGRSIQSQVGAVSAGGGALLGKGQCRDFEEKGYCMRGETCPWDHGVDPVVLEDINNPALLTIQQQPQGGGPHLREYNPDAPDLWNRQNPGNFGRGNGGPGGPNSGPMMNQFGRNPPGFRNPGMMNPLMSQLNRELIPVPVIGEGNRDKRRFDQDENMGMEGNVPPKRKQPLGNRLGPRQNQGQSQIQQNCSLELRKVPRGLNSIAHLNNHFSKFGKIVNIHVNYENDPEAAIVTFSTHAEANVAYRSTEAVLNNRFIKVFWHSNKDSNLESKDGADNQAPMPRKPFPSHQYQLVNNNNQNNPSPDPNSASSQQLGGNQSSTQPISGATAIVAAPAQQRMKTNRVIRKKQQEAAVQLAHGLSKRKQELLQEYLKQMKSVLDLIDRAESGDQRGKLLTTVKELQDRIEKLRKEIATEQAQIAQAQAQNLPPARKTKEQLQKELLDMELELIAQQQEGNDTTLIQKRIQDLQRGLGIRPQFARPGGPAGNRTRLAPPGSTSVDRRPTTLFIAGFKVDDGDALLGHFKHFGEITKHIVDKNIPSLIISYAIRGHAEQAMLRGRIFKERPLQINWYIPNYVNQQVVADRMEAAAAKAAAQNASITGTNNNNSSEEVSAMPTAGAESGVEVAAEKSGLAEVVELPSVEEELQMVEDEEEESEQEDAELEDRSWRR